MSDSPAAPTPADLPPAAGPAEPAPIPLPPPPAAKPAAQWPEWFHALDVAGAAVAVAAAFLAASFAARNSSLFLHLAGGRAVVQGQLSPGTDPFTHAGAAGRPWANTSWLFDLVAYALYAADPSGAALVAVKAAGVAAAFGLLFALRAAGRPLWPWVAGVVLAVVASAASVVVAPATASVLFLAATLVLVFALDWSRPGWRNPLLLGLLFLLWANTDGWVLLGLVTVAAVVVGGRVDAALRLPADERPGTGLARGLLVAAVAGLLNPFVLAAAVKSPGEAVQQLVPWEFGTHLPAAVADDAQLGGLTLGPLSPAILDRATRGDDPNVPALGLLAVLAVVGATARGSAVGGLLVLLGAGVGVLNFRLAPLAAVLLVPPAGWGLNHLAGRVRAGTAADPATRILITVSGLGRFLTLLAAGLVGAAAFPGWLHPPRVDPVYGRASASRVEWAVEPDPGLARTAGLLPGLPADRKGLAVGPDLANYAAWFAPGVRQFVTGRYAFHRADLPDLLVLRAATLGRRGADAVTVPADLDEAAAACDRQGGGYLVVTAGTPPRRVDTLNPVNGQVPAVYALGLGRAGEWTLWHLDGRSAVIGRGPGGRAFDPAAAAFGPADPIPAGPLAPPPPPPSDDAFVQAIEHARAPVRPPPAEADDALTLVDYLSAVVKPQADFEHRRASLEPKLAAAGGPLASLTAAAARPATDAELAVPILAVRAARRAAAAAPDRPEGYRALVAAYRLPLAPVAQPAFDPVQAVTQMPEADAQQLAAAARLLARLPAATPQLDQRAAGADAALALAGRYEQTGQLDLARDAVGTALGLLKGVSGGGGKDDPVAAERKRFEQLEETLSGRVQRQQRAAEQQTAPPAKLAALAQAGLPGKAIELYRTADPAAFGRDAARVALLVVALKLRAGRVEDAAADLDQFDESLRTAADADPQLVGQVRALRAAAVRLAGDPRAALAGLPQAPPPPPAVELRLVLDAPAGLPAFAAATGMAGGWLRNAQLTAQVQNLLGAAQQEAALQADRGLLALLDGDPTEAARRFEAALKPLGSLALADVNPPLADRLTRYLALIRTHAGK